MAAEITHTNNSPTKSSQDPAWITKGTIANVDLRNWTVDVVAEYDGQFYEALQIATPYFHTHNGEGIFALPEVGSICLVCQPSDEDTPYVIGFIGSYELEQAKLANLEDRAGEADTETEELADVKTPSGTTSTAAGQAPGASARGGRPFLNPGDIMMQTRDQNFIVLRRGGVIQIGATPTCQSVWVPLKNFLRQFAENYEVSTPGGMLLWSVERQEKDPAGEAPVMYRLALRDKAQNDKADVQLKIGHVSDTVRYELEVAPQGITVANGEVLSSKLKMTIDTAGTQSFTMSGSLNYTIAQNRHVVIKGTDTVEIGGTRSLSAASETTDLKGAHLLKAALSTENIIGHKAITAATTAIGKVPIMSAVLGEALVIWLTMHKHPVAQVPDENVTQLPHILSKTLKISP